MRTDKPEAEVGLYQNDKHLAYEVWTAHRQLAEGLHLKIQAVLNSQHKNFADLDGIVCNVGPGSFTGLRIGLSVANALAYGLQIPIIGIENQDDWREQGIKRFSKGDNDHMVLPAYGALVHITLPKK